MTALDHPERSPNSIAIIGRGPIGIAFSSYLARVGRCVYFADPRTARKTKTMYRVTGPDKRPHDYSVFTVPIQQITTSPEFVIVCVRAPALASVLGSVKSSSIQGAPALVTANGVSLLDRLSQVGPLIRALVYFGAKRSEKNSVAVFGAPNITLACDPLYNPHLERISEALAAVGFSVAKSPSILQAEWEKLPLNLVVNILATLEDERNGCVIAVPRLKSLASSMLMEFAAVAKAVGVEVESELAHRIFSAIEKVAENSNSTREEIRTSRALELPYITVPFLDAAEKHGIEVPTIRTGFNEVLAMAAAATAKS